MRSLRPDARQLGRLQELTDAALGHLELEQLLGALLERTRTLLDVDTCAILLLDAESNELVPRAAVGIEEKIGRGARIPLGKGFAGRVAAERRPVVLRDVDHADVMNPLLRRSREHGRPVRRVCETLQIRDLRTCFEPGYGSPGRPWPWCFSHW